MLRIFSLSAAFHWITDLCTAVRRVLVAAVVPVGLLAGCGAPPETAVELVRPVRYVEVQTVGGGQLRVFSGVSKAALEADLSFKVAGLVAELGVDVGDRLERGEAVARLEPTDFEVVLREAEAGLERARAEKRNAQSAFDRTRELYENRNAARSDLDAARARAESAQAQLRAVEQQLKAARLQLSYTTLASPEACSVARQYVEANQNVAAGQPIVRVNCGSCAEVVLDVPGTLIGLMRSGADVDVSIASISQQLAGRVTEVGVATDQNRSIYPVKVQLLEGCQMVRSGMAAEATMVLNADQGDAGSILVPSVAVGEDREGNFVFALERDSDDSVEYLATRRSVTVGVPTAEGVEVLSGLAPGELIATAGVRRLREGQRVTLLGADGQGMEIRP